MLVPRSPGKDDPWRGITRDGTIRSRTPPEAHSVFIGQGVVMRRDRARPFWIRLLRREPRSRGDHRVGGEPRASEASLRSALRSGRTVAWEWDLVTDRIIRSENAP